MKKSQIIRALAELLNDVKAHPDVGREITNLVIGTGHEQEFVKILKKQINYVKKFGYRVIELQQFEKLSNCAGLYSMHIESKNFNIRIIYSYYQDGELLLHCFFEKQGKAVTEYKTHIPIAVKRKKEVEGGL